jgi:hypothetical protein
MAAFAAMAFAAFSSAASAVTVLNPGTFTGTASGAVTLTVAGQNFVCTSSSLTGPMNASGAGSISSATFSGRTAGVLGSFVVTQLSNGSSTISSSAGGYALNVTVPRGTTGLARIVLAGLLVQRQRYALEQSSGHGWSAKHHLVVCVCVCFRCPGGRQCVRLLRRDNQRGRRLLPRRLRPLARHSGRPVHGRRGPVTGATSTWRAPIGRGERSSPRWAGIVSQVELAQHGTSLT